MGTFRHLHAQGGMDDFASLWDRSSEVELHQFVGKDVAYFHTLFWPAMLHGAGFRMATGVNVHGDSAMMGPATATEPTTPHAGRRRGRHRHLFLQNASALRRAVGHGMTGARRLDRGWDDSRALRFA